MTTKTIGNPASWLARQLAGSGTHLTDATARVGGDGTAAMPDIRRLSTADLGAALRAGLEDFRASRADALFLVLIYPVVGALLIWSGLHLDLLPLAFPLMAGFALLGPIAALGLYEISRRRESGEPADWLAAFAVLRSPSLGPIVVLSLYLGALFVAWMGAAHAIWGATLGPQPPASVAGFARDVLSTTAGWAMIVLGFGVGFCFALAALAISVVSFPLLIDRNVGVPVALVTSVRVTRENPRVILTWGAIVAAGLVLGSIPVLLGLVIVLPVLGHATWHLYRRAVA